MIFGVIKRNYLFNQFKLLIFSLVFVTNLTFNYKGQKDLDVIFISAPGSVCARVHISDPKGKLPDESVLSAVRKINVYCFCCCIVTHVFLSHCAALLVCLHLLLGMCQSVYCYLLIFIWIRVHLTLLVCAFERMCTCQ